MENMTCTLKVNSFHWHYYYLLVSPFDFSQSLDSSNPHSRSQKQFPFLHNQESYLKNNIRVKSSSINYYFENCQTSEKSGNLRLHIINVPIKKNIWNVPLLDLIDLSIKIYISIYTSSLSLYKIFINNLWTIDESVGNKYTNRFIDVQSASKKKIDPLYYVSELTVAVAFAVILFQLSEIYQWSSFVGNSISNRGCTWTTHLHYKLAEFFIISSESFIFIIKMGRLILYPLVYHHRELRSLNARKLLRGSNNRSTTGHL